MGNGVMAWIEAPANCESRRPQQLPMPVTTAPVLDSTGDFPPRAVKLVLEWMSLHTAELLQNWQLAKQGQPLKRIAPLE